jgi:hypothetical protein
VAGIGVDKVSRVPAPDVWLLDAQREIHRFWLVTPRPGMTRGELDWMRRVQQRYAVPSFQVRYALAAALNDRPDDASASLIRLCNMYRPSWCQQWRDTWIQLQKKYPSLDSVPFPTETTRVLNAARG